MADQQPPPQPQGPPFVGGAFPTVRASASAVFVDGGSFIVHFIEDRPLPNVPAPTAVKANIEVGRIALSPVALVQLRVNIDAAIAQYRALFGQDPPGPDKLPKDAMDAAKRSLLSNLPTSGDDDATP